MNSGSSTGDNRWDEKAGLLISCASSASITWELNASRRRPAFSSHLLSQIENYTRSSVDSAFTSFFHLDASHLPGIGSFTGGNANATYQNCSSHTVGCEIPRRLRESQRVKRLRPPRSRNHRSPQKRHRPRNRCRARKRRRKLNLPRPKRISKRYRRSNRSNSRSCRQVKALASPTISSRLISANRTG